MSATHQPCRGCTVPVLVTLRRTMHEVAVSAVNFDKVEADLFASIYSSERARLRD